MSEQNIQYEKTLQKGIGLLKNNPNAIIDIIQVANRLSYLRGRLFEQNQLKKDDEALHVSHLEPRSNQEEDSTMKCKTNVVDSQVDNPQDDLGYVTSAGSRDNGDGTFPGDSNIAYKKGKEALKRLRQRN